jgi:hypothetical protein
MKKTTYNIKGCYYPHPEKNDFIDWIKSLDGYVVEYSGLRLGISRNYHLSGRPDDQRQEAGHEWKVTELTTGLLVGISAGTLKEAINKLPDFDKWDAVRTAVKRYLENGGKDINPGLEPQNVIYSVKGAA